MMKKKI